MSKDLSATEKELYEAMLPELRKKIQQIFKVSGNINITDEHSNTILKKLGLYLLEKDGEIVLK
jgi:hypothetical protein